MGSVRARAYAFRACASKQTSLGKHLLVNYLVATETLRSPPGETHQQTNEEMVVMNTKAKKLSTLLFATVATMGIGMGSAFAQSSPSASGYVYPDFWGTAAAQTAPKSNAATQSSGDSIGTYATQSSHGTWLFPPDPNGGGNS